MPRKARKLSTTGIYHTMLRGINKQMIFEDAADYDYFLKFFGNGKRVEEYWYSSMEKYFCNSGLVDAEFIFSILSQDDFLAFNNTPNSDMCLEEVSSPRRGVTDAQAQAIIQKVSHCQTMTEFQGLDEKNKARCMKKIHEKVFPSGESVA